MTRSASAVLPVIQSSCALRVMACCAEAAPRQSRARPGPRHLGFGRRTAACSINDASPQCSSGRSLILRGADPRCRRSRATIAQADNHCKAGVRLIRVQRKRSSRCATRLPQLVGGCRRVGSSERICICKESLSPSVIGRIATARSKYGVGSTAAITVGDSFFAASHELVELPVLSRANGPKTNATQNCGRSGGTADQHAP